MFTNREEKMLFTRGRYHLLHLDPDPCAQSKVNKYILSLGNPIRITNATTIEEAKRAMDNSIDCIISEYFIDDENCLEFLLSVQNKYNIPIIIHTNQGNEELAERAFNTGVDGYLVKKNEDEISLLLQQVNNLIDKKRATDLYAKISQNTTDALCITDGATILMINQSLLDLLEADSKDEIYLKQYHKWIHPDDLPLVQVNQTGDTLTPIQFRIITKTNQTKTVEASLSHIKYRGKQVTLSVIRDLSDRIELQNKLHKQGELLTNILESTVDGIVILDTDFKIRTVNPSFLKMSNKSETDYIGKHLTIAFPHLNNTSRLDEYIRVRETGTPFNYESKTENGPYLNILGYRIPDGLVISVSDITERINYHNQLESILIQSRLLSEAKSIEEIASISVSGLQQVIGAELISFQTVEEDHLWTVLTHPYTTPLKMPLDGKGITVKAANSKQPVLVFNVEDDPDFLFWETNVKSELAVPVLIAGETVAVLNVESAELGKYTYNDQMLLEIFSEEVGLTISRLQFNRELEKYQTRLEALHEHSTLLEQTGSVEEVATQTLSIIERLFEFNTAGFMEIQETNLVEIASKGSTFVGLTLPLNGRGVTIRAINQKKTQLVLDPHNDPDYVDTGDELFVTRTELSVPIIIENVVYGVINLETDQTNAYNEYDQKIIEILSEHVSSALTRIRYYETQIRMEHIEQLDEIKIKFIQTAAHELRTPVTAIRGFIEILTDIYGSNLPEEVTDILSIVDRNAVRLTSMTNDLLDMQRIESGRMQLITQVTNLNDIIREISEELKVHTDQRQQLVELDLTNGFETHLDQDRISQVLINLIQNASKFSPNDSKIQVSSSNSNGKVIVSIKDEGIGLKSEDLEKLFKPYPDINHGNNVSSTGLGLSITKGIIDLHGGEIWVESEGLGKGSTFTFSLPL